MTSGILIVKADNETFAQMSICPVVHERMLNLLALLVASGALQSFHQQAAAADGRFGKPFSSAGNSSGPPTDVDIVTVSQKHTVPCWKTDGMLK